MPDTQKLADRVEHTEQRVRTLRTAYDSLAEHYQEFGRLVEGFTKQVSYYRAEVERYEDRLKRVEKRLDGAINLLKDHFDTELAMDRRLIKRLMVIVGLLVITLIMLDFLYQAATGSPSLVAPYLLKPLFL